MFSGSFGWPGSSGCIMRSSSSSEEGSFLSNSLRRPVCTSSELYVWVFIKICWFAISYGNTLERVRLVTSFMTGLSISNILSSFSKTFRWSVS